MKSAGLNKSIPRRKFIRNSAATLASVSIVPSCVLGGATGNIAPSDQLRIAGIGAGGKGYGDLVETSGYNAETGNTLERVVALCDVDQNMAARAYEAFPKAARYKDFRVMLDEMHKEIDAVIVSTPDHMHAAQALPAMQLGKHVYVQKPLTHDVWEARMLTEAANRYGVVTQMGNQGNSSDDIRKIKEWIDAGVIGDVTEVKCWTNRPVWPQGLSKITGKDPVPAHFDWDLWLGTAPWRDHKEGIAPFSWRGWWDYGTGALGDMACHIIDPVFMALDLGYPDSVESYVTTFYKDWQIQVNDEACPPSSIIHFRFPKRGERPPVKLSWYDGGLMPERPEELKDGESMGEGGGGVIFYGSKGKMMCDVYARNPRLLPLDKMEDFTPPAETIARVPQGHYRSWVEAIKGNAPAPSSNFDYAGPLTETILMGNLAIRSFFIQEEIKGRNGKMQKELTGRKKLLWDGAQMKITNYDLANQFVKRKYRKGWNVQV